METPARTPQAPANAPTTVPPPRESGVVESGVNAAYELGAYDFRQRTVEFFQAKIRVLEAQLPVTTAALARVELQLEIQQLRTYAQALRALPLREPPRR